MQCNMYLFSPPLPNEYYILFAGGPVAAVSYEPAHLLRQLGLATERFIVPFSSKGVNRMAYRAHVVTDVWCVLLFV